MFPSFGIIQASCPLMPSGTIADHDCVCCRRDLRGNPLEMPVHALGTAGRRDDRRADIPGWTRLQPGQLQLAQPFADRSFRDGHGNRLVISLRKATQRQRTT